MISIVPATVMHAVAMFPNLRAGDRRELDLFAEHDDPLAVMVAGVARSIEASTALIGGRVAAMWGIVAESALAADGHPWLLTTPIVEAHRKAFLRVVRAEVYSMRTRWRTLSGNVDPGYVQAVRMLRRIGFEIRGPSGCPGLSIFSDEGVR